MLMRSWAATLSPLNNVEEGEAVQARRRVQAKAGDLCVFVNTDGTGEDARVVECGERGSELCTVYLLRQQVERTTVLSRLWFGPAAKPPKPDPDPEQFADKFWSVLRIGRSWSLACEESFVCKAGQLVRERQKYRSDYACLLIRKAWAEELRCTSGYWQGPPPASSIAQMLSLSNDLSAELSSALVDAVRTQLSGHCSGGAGRGCGRVR